jgi:uncharacterized membrane protein YfcA
MSTALVAIAVIGFVAQFVDGSLGMGYGVTSTTLLLSAGLAPAVASASVHMAELGTTLASGAAHWRFGNVDWQVVWPLAIPGAVGAFAGAYVLSNISAGVARPWVSLILSCLAMMILARALIGRTIGSAAAARPRARALGPLGLVGGFLDAAGGGGWGPVTTSSLMAASRMQPRHVIGTVSMSEFLVTAGASIGFLVGLGVAGFAWDAVAVLLAGGLIAAPIAAWVVRHVDYRSMGVAVAGMILYSNAERVLALVGIGPRVADVVELAIVFGAGGLVVGLFAGRRTRSEAEPAEGLSGATP